MTVRPLPLIATTAIALYAGVLAGLRAADAPARDLLLVACAVCALSRFRPDSTRFVATLLLGGCLGWSAGRDALGSCAASIPDGARLRVRAVLLALPTEDGAAAVRARRLGGAGHDVACGAELRVRFRTVPAGQLPTGDAEVVLAGRWWATPRAAGWPIRPGRTGVLLVDSIAGTEAPAPLLLRTRIAAQRRARVLFGNDAGTVEALLLARAEGLERGRRDAYARSGLAHILSISGFHVGLIAAALALTASLARVPARRAGPAVAAVTLGYVLFIGAPAPAVRAALQVLLLLGARGLQRPTDPFAPVAAAALVILLAEPLQAIDAGFQLSFAGTVGLIALRRPLLERLAVLPRALRENLAAGAAATAATMPLTALHFHQVAPVGVLANLVAVPLAALAVPAAALALLTGSVVTAAGRFLAGGASLLLRALDGVARLAGAVPYGHAETGVATVLVAGAAAAAGVALLRRGPARRRALPYAVVVAAAIGWPAVAARVGAGAGLEIHMIDVGQGDAIAIRTPARRWVLVDAGVRSADRDAGRDAVVPYLRRRGASRIDLLVLTHPDGDHIGGARAVIQALEVSAVLDPAAAVGKPQYLETVAAALAEPARWLPGRAGRELVLDDVILRVLHPGPILDAAAETNDLGVVFRLEFGRFAALFTGDASAAVEQALVDDGESLLRSAVLKVGHHGSATSTSGAFLDAVQPRTALVSVGRRNRYGHPAPAVLQRLAEHGVDVRRTDREGAIVVTAGADGSYVVRSERGGVPERRSTSSARSSVPW